MYNTVYNFCFCVQSNNMNYSIYKNVLHANSIYIYYAIANSNYDINSTNIVLLCSVLFTIILYENTMYHHSYINY